MLPPLQGPSPIEELSACVTQTLQARESYSSNIPRAYACAARPTRWKSVAEIKRQTSEFRDCYFKGGLCRVWRFHGGESSRCVLFWGGRGGKGEIMASFSRLRSVMVSKTIVRTLRMLSSSTSRGFLSLVISFLVGDLGSWKRCCWKVRYSWMSHCVVVSRSRRFEGS